MVLLWLFIEKNKKHHMLRYCFGEDIHLKMQMIRFGSFLWPAPLV